MTLSKIKTMPKPRMTWRIIFWIKFWLKLTRQAQLTWETSLSLLIWLHEKIKLWTPHKEAGLRAKLIRRNLGRKNSPTSGARSWPVERTKVLLPFIGQNSKICSRMTPMDLSAKTQTKWRIGAKKLFTRRELLLKLNGCPLQDSRTLEFTLRAAILPYFVFLRQRTWLNSPRGFYLRSH